MSKEKKTDIWILLFILIPGFLFGKIAEIFNDKSLAYTVVLTIIGVALGFLLHFLTKNKSLIIKIISLSFTIIIPFGVIFFSNQNEIEKEWLNQTINAVEFSAPYKLKLSQSDIPKELEEYYSKFEIYRDGKNDKSTIIYSIKLKDENIDLEDYFKQYLESIKEIIPSLKAVEIIEQKKTENDIYTRFKFITKNQSLNGSCRLIKKGKNINIFWLVPFSQDFSKKYIDKFDKSIKK
jgi:hypothetical protein